MTHSVTVQTCEECGHKFRDKRGLALHSYSHKSKMVEDQKADGRSEHSEHSDSINSRVGENLPSAASLQELDLSLIETENVKKIHEKKNVQMKKSKTAMVTTKTGTNTNSKNSRDKSANKQQKTEFLSVAVRMCEECGQKFTDENLLLLHRTKIHKVKSSSVPPVLRDHQKSRSKDSGLHKNSTISHVEENLPSVIMSLQEEVRDELVAEKEEPAKAYQETKNNIKNSAKKPGIPKIRMTGKTKQKTTAVKPKVRTGNNQEVQSKLKTSRKCNVSNPAPVEETSSSPLYPSCLGTPSCHCTRCLPCFSSCCHNLAVRRGLCCQLDTLGRCLQPTESQCAAPCCYHSVAVHSDFKIIGNKLENREVIQFVKPFTDCFTEDLTEAEQILANNGNFGNEAGNRIFAESLDEDDESQEFLFDAITDFLLEDETTGSSKYIKEESYLEPRQNTFQMKYLSPSTLPTGCSILHSRTGGKLQLEFMASGGAVFQSLPGLLSYYHRQVGQYQPDVYSERMLEHPGVSHFLLDKMEEIEDWEVMEADNCNDDQEKILNGGTKGQKQVDGENRQQIYLQKETSAASSTKHNFKENIENPAESKEPTKDIEPNGDPNKEFNPARNARESENVLPITVDALVTDIVNRNSRHVGDIETSLPMRKQKNLDASNKEDEGRFETEKQKVVPNVKKVKNVSDKDQTQKVAKESSKLNKTRKENVTDTNTVTSDKVKKINATKTSRVPPKVAAVSSQHSTKRRSLPTLNVQKPGTSSSPHANAVKRKSTKQPLTPQSPAQSVQESDKRTPRSSQSQVLEPPIKRSRRTGDIVSTHSSDLLERTSSAVLRAKGRNNQGKKKLAPMGPMKFYCKEVRLSGEDLVYCALCPGDSYGQLH